jgi:hypothetical protein
MLRACPGHALFPALVGVKQLSRASGAQVRGCSKDGWLLIGQGGRQLLECWCQQPVVWVQMCGAAGAAAAQQQQHLTCRSSGVAPSWQGQLLRGRRCMAAGGGQLQRMQ